MSDTRKDFNYFQNYCALVTDSVFKGKGKRHKEKFLKQVFEIARSEDRIKFVYEDSSFSRHFETIRASPVFFSHKCTVVAREKAESAYNLYKLNEFEESLARFSEAILHVPFPEDDPTASDLWVHCFSQRAVIYYKLQQYANAIVDLEEGIKHSRDVGLKVILVWYKVACRNALKHADKTHLVNVQLSSKNEFLDGAIEDIKLIVHPVKGRTMVATSPLKAGTLVVAQPAFVSWLRPSLYQRHCGHCLKSLDGRCYPCRQCVEVRYCSWKCAREAWKSYHSYECSHLSVLKNLVFGLMGLRTIIVLGVDNMINDYLSGPKKYKWEGEYFGDDLKAFTSLVAEMQQKDIDFEWEVIVGALVMALFAERMGLIERKSEHYFTFCAILRRSILQVLLNCFYVYEESITQSGVFNILTVDPDYHDIGFAVYSTASMFSHSCECNANRFFIGSTIHVHLSKDVAASEEISIDYGADTYHNSVSYRRGFLKNSFGFECQCKACRETIENVHFALKCYVCDGFIINDASADYSNYCMSCGTQNLRISGYLSDVKTADDYYRKGEKALVKGKVRKAKHYLKKSLKIYERTYCTKVASKDIYALLANCYVQQKKYTLASYYCHQVAEIQSSLCGRDSWDYANMCLRYITLRLKDFDETVGTKSKSDLDKITAMFTQTVKLINSLKEREVNITNKTNVKYLPVLDQMQEGLLQRAESLKT